MPKAYAVVAYRSVPDPQKLAAYGQLALPAVVRFGALILARGNAAMALEDGLKERIVVIEYPSLEKAVGAYSSAAYAEALKALGDGVVRDFRIVEGSDADTNKALQQAVVSIDGASPQPHTGRHRLALGHTCQTLWQSADAS